MFRKHSGTSTVEWIVVGVIVLGVVGASIIALGDTIAEKLRDINVQVGS